MQEYLFGLGFPEANDGTVYFTWVVPPDFAPGGSVRIKAFVQLSTSIGSPVYPCSLNLQQGNIVQHDRPGVLGSVGDLDVDPESADGAATFYTGNNQIREVSFRIDAESPLQTSDVLLLSLSRLPSSSNDTCTLESILRSISMEYTPL